MSSCWLEQRDFFSKLRKHSLPSVRAVGLKWNRYHLGFCPFCPSCLTVCSFNFLL